MSPENALHLYNQINNGPAVGCDQDGNTIRNETFLANCFEMLGAQTYVAFEHSDANWKNNGRQMANVYAVKEQVAFLREWADALELCGPLPAPIPPKVVYGN